MAYGYLISFHEFSHSTLHSLVCHATKNFQPLFKDQSGKQKVTNSFSRADLTNYYTDVSYTITFVKTFQNFTKEPQWWTDCNRCTQSLS